MADGVAVPARRECRADCLGDESGEMRARVDDLRVGEGEGVRRGRGGGGGVVGQGRVAGDEDL